MVINKLEKYLHLRCREKKDKNSYKSTRKHSMERPTEKKGK